MSCATLRESATLFEVLGVDSAVEGVDHTLST